MKTNLFLLIFMLFQVLSFATDYETYIIIIGGGNKPEDAKIAKENYLKQTDLTRQVKADIQIVFSDSIQGLNPGYHIAILGFCPDEIKARLLTNFANKYLQGVYFKKVKIKAEHESPEFSPDNVPFSGKDYKVQTKAFSFFYNDIKYGKVIYVSKPNTAIVKTDKVVFTEKSGMVTIKYYIGWIKETKQIVYLNQFQFSRIFDDSDEWLADCDEDEDLVEYGPDFKATEKKVSCTYENGVTSYTDDGYEWSTLRVRFPSNKFTFEEVFNYYVGQGYFDFIFEEKTTKGIEMFNSESDCTKTYIPNKEVRKDCDHYNCTLTIDDNGIEFHDGGGA